MSHPQVLFSHSALVKAALAGGHLPEAEESAYSRNIEVEQYNLALTMLSSYACYFFAPTQIGERIEPFRWAGVLPPFEGLSLTQTAQSSIVVGSNSELQGDLLEYVEEAIGLRSPFFRAPEGLEALANKYPGIRIPRLRRNLLDVLVAILCSGHATISRGRRWTLFLKKNFEPLDAVMGLGSQDLMAMSEKACGVSMGYRARYVQGAIGSLVSRGGRAGDSLEEMVGQSEADTARRKLLSIRFVGPKTADCFLLNALGTTYVPPVDVHVLRVASRIKLFKHDFGLPVREFCKEFVCSPEGDNACPLAKVTEAALSTESELAFKGCLRSALKQAFEHAAWVQALIFMHGVVTCGALDPGCTECGLQAAGACRGPILLLARKPRLPRAPRPPTMSLEMPETVMLFPERADAIAARARQIIEELGKRGVHIPRKRLFPTAIWIAARLDEMPLTLKEIGIHYNLKSGDVFRVAEDVVRELDLSLPVVGTFSHIHVIGRSLGLPDDVAEEAIFLAKILGSDGPTPVAAATACIRHVLRERGETALARELKDTSQVTDVTLRKYERSILEAIKRDASTRLTQEAIVAR